MDEGKDRAEKSKRSHTWFRGPHIGYSHSGEYLQKLTRMRQELLKQEQKNMSLSMDRLRLRNDVRESLTFRNRSKTLVPGFLSTGDRYRKAKRQPILVPVLGRQLIEPRQSVSKSFSAPDTVRSLDLIRSTDQDTIVEQNMQRIWWPKASCETKDVNEMLIRPRLRKRKTFIKQMSMHEKLPQTRIYKGTHKHPPHHMKINTSQVTLAVVKSEENEGDFATLTFPLLESKHDNNQGYMAPMPTPITNNDKTLDGQFMQKHNVQTHLPSLESDYRNDWRDRADQTYDNNRTSTNRSLELTARGTSFLLKKYHENESEIADSNDSNEDDTTDNQINGIVIKMPSIVFKPATPLPEMTEPYTLSLRKTCVQNELRRKEVKNLIEDVIELGERNEAICRTCDQ